MTINELTDFVRKNAQAERYLDPTYTLRLLDEIDRLRDRTRWHAMSEPIPERVEKVVARFREVMQKQPPPKPEPSDADKLEALAKQHTGTKTEIDLRRIAERLREMETKK